MVWEPWATRAQSTWVGTSQRQGWGWGRLGGGHHRTAPSGSELPTPGQWLRAGDGAWLGLRCLGCGSECQGLVCLGPLLGWGWYQH